MTDEWGRPILLKPTPTPLLDSFARAAAKGIVHGWGTASTGTTWPYGIAHGSGWAPPPEVRASISAEDYAVIDEVIIDSVARGYVQRRRDGID